MLLHWGSITLLVSLASALHTEPQCDGTILLQRQKGVLKHKVSVETLKLIEVSHQYHHLRNFSNLESCPLPCTQAKNKSEADVVFAYSGATVPSRSSPKQVWVATFWESPDHYPSKSHDFDYSMSWRADATFPQYDMIPYTVVDMFDERLERLRTDFPFPRRSSFSVQSGSDRKISVWISNCAKDKTARLTNAKRLHEAGVHFASYGKCLHNAQTDAQGGEPATSLVDRTAQMEATRIMTFLRSTRAMPSARDRDMYDTSSKHMFFFAAENSDCAYYHTEKVYNGLLSGSIPVYNGNPQTIDGYVPKGSIIKTADFKSPEDLAKHLLKVASNETLYNSYFEWWRQDLKAHSPVFREKLLARRYARNPEEEVQHRCGACTFLHSHGRNPKFDAKSITCEP